MALTETTETSDTILKDDCALVVACLSNLSTFALQQPPPGMRHPVLKICGAGCMRWLQQLAVLDSGYAQRLAGSLYRNTSKAAVLADDLAASPSTCVVLFMDRFVHRAEICSLDCSFMLPFCVKLNDSCLSMSESWIVDIFCMSFSL